MKSVLVLVVILHLCDSFRTPLNAELIKQLKTLKQELNGTKVTPPVYMPSKHMSQNTHVCAGVFFRKLRVMLNNLLAHHCCKDSVRMLLANLDAMGPIPEDHQNCTMVNRTSKILPVLSYINFITKLNT